MSRPDPRSVTALAAVDGALGAELINAFRQLIENPMGMLV